MTDNENRFVVRIRGLPWSTTSEEVRDFFSDVNLLNELDSIHMTLTREGRPSGEAYIELNSKEDLEIALKKHHQHLGKRYVEVFTAKYQEMEWVVKRCRRNSEVGSGLGPLSTDFDNNNVLRLRGLPFDCLREDIIKFFEGLDIAANGILMTTDQCGRSTGEAFVQFVTKASLEAALEKNKESIGHRYIEIFRSSLSEAKSNQMGDSVRVRRPPRGYASGNYPPLGNSNMRGFRPSPYDRRCSFPNSRNYKNYKNFGDEFASPSGSSLSSSCHRQSSGYGDYGPLPPSLYNSFHDSYGSSFENIDYLSSPPPPPPLPPSNSNSRRYVVHMRGLPFRVTEDDIAEWFSSLVDPVHISIIYNNQGRPAGEADVLFSSESDARKAMMKDRHNMQHRYVELFYDGLSVDNHLTSYGRCLPSPYHHSSISGGFSHN